MRDATTRRESETIARSHAEHFASSMSGSAREIARARSGQSHGVGGRILSVIFVEMRYQVRRQPACAREENLGLRGAGSFSKAFVQGDFVRTRA